MLLHFFIVSVIGITLIFLTSLITYHVLNYVWKVLPHVLHRSRLRVLLVMLPIFIAHIINIWLYAIVFFVIENFTSIGKLVGSSREVAVDYYTFQDCLYFSSVTYTSLGFGDILATHDLQMLTAAEALNGLLMIGWTVSFTYLVMERFWATSRHNPHS